MATSGDPIPSGSAPVPARQSAAAPYASVAVLLPCYNEEATIAGVVRGFRNALPGATVYVFDNNSKDRTAALAREAGAFVVESTRQGKGNVVRHMFDMIDVATYVLADGDATYPPEAAPGLVDVARTTGADMVVGTRLLSHGRDVFRPFHRFGNRLISRLITLIFKIDVADVLSGYRVFSRDFVRSVPLASQGFEIETELTLQAAAKKFVIREVPIDYGARPPGSHSKLNTWGDGLLIVKLIFLISRDYKPLTFFGSLAILAVLGSVGIGLPPLLGYVRTGAADVPMVLLAAALAIIGCILAAIGLLLHTIRNFHQENFELWRRLVRQIDQSHVHSGVYRD